MLVVGCKRELLLGCLPKRGKVAEIGVAEGIFSREIWSRTDPAELHLIDPWVHQAIPQHDLTNVSDVEFDGRYRAILRLFGPEIEQGRIFIHREFSTAAVNRFPDSYFDWVYVDALHDRESVFKDLTAYYSKVKDEGFILGHDFTNHPWARQMSFGVVEAVADFCKEKTAFFLLLTDEFYPTFVLAKFARNQTDLLLARILRSCDYAVEFNSFDFRKFTHKLLNFSDGFKRLLLSF